MKADDVRFKRNIEVSEFFDFRIPFMLNLIIFRSILDFVLDGLRVSFLFG